MGLGLRIAHVTDCYLPRLGGIELLVHDLAAHQLAAGHEVTVITPTAATRRVAPEDLDDVPVRRAMRPHWVLPDLVRPAALRTGRHAVRYGGFDAVHVHVSVLSPFAFAVADAAELAGLPVVITLHSLWANAEPVFRAALRSGRWTGRAVLWSAVSEVAAASLSRVLGGREVLVLPNATDVAGWRVTPEDREPDDVVIASVARLVRRKRPMPLLRMLRRVRERVPDRIALRAVLIGDGPRRRELEAYLARNGMADWVRLPGRFSREEIHTVYRRADMYVAPAPLESFGIAALEARSAGLPVVAHETGGIGGFVRHDREGLLVPSDDAMVDAVVRLACDPAARARMTAASRARPPRMSWADALLQSERAYALAGAPVPAELPLEVPLGLPVDEPAR